MPEEQEQSGHEFLDGCVERGETREFAEFMNRSVSLMEKWMREPASDESPNASGVDNPIKFTDRIMEWCLLYKPERAVMLAGRYARKLQRFRERQQRQPLTQAELRAQLRQVIKEHSDILKALVGGASVAEVRKEKAEFDERIEELLARLEAGECDPLKLQHPAAVRGATR